MTSEPNNPICDAGRTPPEGAVDPGVGQTALPPIPDAEGLTLMPQPVDGGEPPAGVVPPSEQSITEPPGAQEPVKEQEEQVPQEQLSATPPTGELAAVEQPASEPPAEVISTAEQPAAEQPPVEPPAEAPPPPPEPKSDKMDWYILKVQSNREDSIREGLRRRLAIAGYDRYFGDIIVPTEKVTEFKAGKRRVFKRKLYPGYLVVQMEINEDTWFLVRETPGIGDFTGAAGHPTPMHAREVAAILAKQEEKADVAPKLKINFSVGDHVKIKEGTFENFEGDVASIDETNGRVTVLINIFGRSTPVDIEYWQIEAV